MLTFFYSVTRLSRGRNNRGGSALRLLANPLESEEDRPDSACVGCIVVDHWRPPGLSQLPNLSVASALGIVGISLSFFGVSSRGSSGQTSLVYVGSVRLFLELLTSATELRVS